MTATLTVLWSCGKATGPPQWYGTESYECPECPGEGEFEVTVEDFHAGDMERVSCDNCGQYLEDDYHYDPEPPDGLSAWNRVMGPDL